MNYWPLRPSNADKVVQCPGSVVLEMQTPEEPDSTDAEEGRRAHAIAADYLKRILIGESVEVTNDMERYAYKYGHALFGPYIQPKIEHKLNIPLISPHMQGTPDFYGSVYGQNRFIIADYKYGFGLINPFELYQLIAYAAGIITDLDGEIAIDNTTQIHLVIFQPRPYHPAGPKRVWETTVGELQPYFGVLREACDNALGPNPRFASGPRCQYCRARHGCETLRESSLFVVDYLEHPFLTEMPDYDLGRELSLLTEAKGVIDARIDALQTVALDRVRSGSRIYGWNTKEQPGKLKWAEGARVEEVAVYQGIDVVKKSLKTPTQAKELGMDITGLAERGPGKTVLVQTDTSEAERVFGK